jgi:hypothetical protein
MTSTEPAVTLSTPVSSLLRSELSMERATGRTTRCSPKVAETFGSCFPGRPASIAVRIDLLARRLNQLGHLKRGDGV